MKTSLTDTDSYKKICQLFVDNDTIFETFRSYHNDYNRVLEHVSPKQGREYLDMALDAYPDMALSRIVLNDLVGNPRKFYYEGYGDISPTTLRYAKVMADIHKQTDGNIGDQVIEIGGGYGGQCRIIYDFMAPELYTIVDLGVVTRLQEKYLTYFYPSPRVKYLTPGTMDKIRGKRFDFVISNFAFDELLPDQQEIYYNYIIKNSKHGYLSGRFTYPGHMTLDDFMDIKDVSIRKYIPDTGFNCHIITW